MLVDQDEHTSTKRKLEESEKRNIELEKQVKEGRVDTELSHVDQGVNKQVTSDSSKDSEALRKFLVGKMEIIQTENETLKEKVRGFEEGRMLLNEKVKSGREEIEKLRNERELVMSAALESDEKYRLLTHSVDQRLMESKGAANAGKAFFDEQMATASDLQLRMSQAETYIQQLHMTLMQYDEYHANVLRESGSLRSELEALRLQCKDNSIMWENWHNSEMAAVCGDTAQAKRELDSSIAYGIEMSKSLQSTKLDLQSTTTKLEEAKSEIRVHKTNVDSLEMRLRNAKAEASAPVGAAAEDEPIKIEEVEDMAATYETRIQDKRDEIYGLQETIQAKDELLEQMQSEIIDANRRSTLKDADMRRAAPGLSAPVGASPLSTPVPNAAPEKPKTQSQRMLEMLYKARSTEGPTHVRERDHDEESYHSANEDQRRAPSEAGTNSIKAIPGR
jgi:chromosome segregation ATPase